MDSDNPVLRFPDDRDILFSGYNGFKNCVYACDNTPIYILINMIYTHVNFNVLCMRYNNKARPYKS